MTIRTTYPELKQLRRVPEYGVPTSHLFNEGTIQLLRFVLKKKQIFSLIYYISLCSKDQRKKFQSKKVLLKLLNSLRVKEVLKLKQSNFFKSIFLDNFYLFYRSHILPLFYLIWHDLKKLVINKKFLKSLIPEPDFTRLLIDFEKMVLGFNELHQCQRTEVKNDSSR